MNPLVSIIIPAYNSEKWIKVSLLSAINQTWQNKEIIVIDDGSVDNTFNIVKQYESGRLKILRQENRGASAARNHGLSVAKGDYIQWLDADDILAPDKIYNQLNAIGNNPDPRILLSSAWGYFFHRLKSVRISPNTLWQNLTPIDWMKQHLEKQYFMANCSWLVTRELTNSTGGWNEKLSYNDDGEYFFRIITKCKAIQFQHNAFSYYRKGNFGSLSRTISVSTRAFKSLSLSINLCVDEILKLDSSPEVKQACVSALNRLVHNNDLAVADIVNANRQRILNLGGVITVPAVTKKFKLVSKFIGHKQAAVIKVKLWYLQIWMTGVLEKIQSFIYNDRV